MEGRKKVPGGTITMAVHRLVCMAFHPIDNPQDYHVDHIDNNPLNNTASNLRWVTRQQNNSRRHARKMKSQNHKSIKHSSEFVRATNLKTGEILYFKNGQAFADFANCSHPLTYMALDGNIPSAKGWRLEWVDRDLPECEAIRIQVENERQAKKDEKEMKYQARLAKAREDTKRRKEAIRQKKEELNRKHKELILRLKDEQRRARMEDVVQKRQIKLKQRELKAKANKEMWELHIVLQCDLDGNILREWRTARDAELETGIRGIGVAIRNGKPFRGYIWKYKIPREPRIYTND